jgi:hypothetical protein
MTPAVNWSTGQAFSQWLVPTNEVVLDWVARFLGPVAVTYEAGPTRFALARAFTAAGVRCEVVAASTLERPPGDRVKTDRRDARRLTRLLHIGEATGITIPTVAQEDARDLAREAYRASWPGPGRRSPSPTTASSLSPRTGSGSTSRSPQRPRPRSGTRPYRRPLTLPAQAAPT